MASIVGDYSSDLVLQQGMDPDSGILGAMQHLPATYTTMGWNARRGSRTILRGGFDETRFLGRKPHVLSIFGNHTKRISGTNPLGPRSWTRFANQNMLYDDPHSPLDFLARGANWVANAGMRGAASVGASGSDNFATNLAQSVMSKTERNAIRTEGGKQEFFSRGFIARSEAATRIGRGGSLTGKRLSSVMNFVGKDAGIGTALGNYAKGRQVMGAFGMNAPGLGKEGYSHLVQASMQGTVSQFAGGYMRSAVSGMPGREAFSILEAAGKKSYLGGAMKATEALGRAGFEVEGGRLLARSGTEAFAKFGAEKVGFMSAAKFGGGKAAGVMAARGIGMAIPFVDAAMMAWMAYDLTKMGVSLMKGGVQSLVDAGKSFKGSVEKGVMGMGYRDTTIAATSRQRGVMAIQNSRLNARSVLGSEAGMLAAHFG